MLFCPDLQMGISCVFNKMANAHLLVLPTLVYAATLMSVLVLGNLR